MKVLIACEFSGVVREAFRARGHDAWSCDLEESEIKGNHIVGDVREVLNDGWDLMIAHPPCRYITTAAAWRWKDTEDEILRGVEFFLDLMQAPIDKWCIENPQNYLCGVITPDQVTCYSKFGHWHRKRTCFWLKGLPPLFERFTDFYGRDFQDSVRDKVERLKTPECVAEAMAVQWG